MDDRAESQSYSEHGLWNGVNDSEEAFKKLFNLYYQPLCLYAKRYVDDAALCQDLVQDIFAALWTDRRQTHIQTSIHSYLVVSVRNRCFDYLRKKRNMELYEEACRENEAPLSHSNDFYLLSELQELLDKALARLPETYRRVFEMSRLEGKSFDEIALTLDISVRTAKRYASQTRDELKRELKDFQQ